MVEALWTADRKGWERIVLHAAAIRSSRDVERDALPVCEKFGIGAITRSPLEGGWLAGRHRSRPAAADSARRQRDRVPACSCATTSFSMPARGQAPRLDAVEALVGMAEEVGASMPAYTRRLGAATPGRHQHHRRPGAPDAASDAGTEALSVKIPDAHPETHRRVGRAGHPRLSNATTMDYTDFTDGRSVKSVWNLRGGPPPAESHPWTNIRFSNLMFAYIKSGLSQDGDRPRVFHRDRWRAMIGWRARRRHRGRDARAPSIVLDALTAIGVIRKDGRRLRPRSDRRDARW